MPTPGSDNGPSAQAQLACSSCRLRKRKCNKALPQCSQCAKRNMSCDYSRSDPYPTPTSDSDRVWYIHPVNEQQADAQSLDYPTVLFLDPTILQHGQVDLSRSALPAPTHMLHLLGDIDEMHIVANSYFGHIHTWLPFVSKKRFFASHLRPAFHSQPDVVLLLLAMKLVTTPPPPRPRNPRTPLYQAVKHYHLDVESSSTLTTPVLQAGILLALYEILHAIYPAAFQSIGACARYAHALGINVSKSLNIRRMLTLVEAEERRRVWWAIVILDRFLSIGCPGRPFVTADPGLDDLLPADDAAWDQGILSSDECIALSSPMTANMSKFALLCQAARLLGQVIYHASLDSGMDEEVCLQLERTLQSMLAAALEVESPDNDQINFIYSALLALHMPALDPRVGNTPAAQRAKAAVQYIADRISANMIEGQCLVGRNPEDMSPWGLYFAYHICRLHMPSRRNSPSSAKLVRCLRETFIAIDTRWSLAGVYLELLEAQEAMAHY